MRTFNKTEDQGDFQIAPEGTTLASLTVLAFCGRHERTWQGETKTQELLGLSWELAEPGPDGRALAVTEVLTASLHEKSKFFSRIMGLTGGREPPAGFELAGLLGRGAVVTVAHVQKGDRTYANVVAVGPLPRGMAAPIPSVTPTFYDIDEHDQAAYDALPARFKKLVETAESADYRPAPPPPARPAAPAGAWSGTHSAQAPYAPAAPPPAWGTQTRRPAPPLPASPADAVPFDDDIPF
jgi:hypothetical protein